MVITMNFQMILIATVVVAAVGLIIGVLLGIAGQKFYVEVDEKEEKVRAALPGNNCGGCGYAGCDGLAAAIVKGEAEISGCPVGGAAVAAKVGEIMGVDASGVEKKVAFVKCAGNCEKAGKDYNYSGINDCRMATVLPGGGDKSCIYGCLGYGSCVSVCEFGALSIKDGIAVVDKEKCVSCGKCVKACPKNLIELVPYDADCKVRCASKDKGKDVRAVCTAGCIACGMCERNCPQRAVNVVDNVAVIDYEKCTRCGLCATKCPTKVITGI